MSRAIVRGIMEQHVIRERDDEHSDILHDAREKILMFTQYTFPQYKADPFHVHVAKHLDLVVKGEIKNLMLFAPPQHGKSELVSTRLPSFWLANNPDLPVALVSYGASLAYRNSRYARSVFESPLYTDVFPEHVRDTQNWRMADWHLADQKGYVLAVGVGGPITGHGFGLGIIDDPIENWAAAQSEALRERVWQWWLGTFKTRMWEGGSIVFMMCMPGDTRVMMANGSWRFLDTIRPDEYVMTRDGDELRPAKVEHFVPQGKARTLQIKTGNHTVRATGNHPFLVRVSDRNKWMRADQLKVGDKIVVLGCWANGNMPTGIGREDAWALGFMLGDGWITKHPRKDTGTMRWATCIARSEDEQKNNRILNYFESRFGRRPTLKKSAGYYRTEVAKAGRWMERLGFSGQAKTKRVPEHAFGWPLEYRRALIAGFIDADGHYWNNDRVEIVSANRLLIDDIKLLAESCGYRTSNIYHQSGTYQPPGSPEPIKSSFYKISFSLKNLDLETFALKKITEITYGGAQEVYDLTVEGTHNFIAEGCVVHNTRWHEDDLAGRILRQEGRIEEGGKWTVISYPALADHEEGKDQLGREPGEPLAPSRYSQGYLMELRDDLGPNVWSAEYQQKPTKPEGDIFKIGRIQITETIPANIADVELPEPTERRPEPYPILKQTHMGTRAWDLAASEKKMQKQDPDFTVGFLVAFHEGNTYLLDMVRGQMSPDQVEDTIIMTAHMDGRSVRVRIEQEPGQSGKAQVARFIKMLAGYDVDGVSASGDKVVRSNPLAAQVNAGNVFMLRAPWNKYAINELAGFPNAAHDDVVDAAAYAFNDQTTGESWARISFKSL